MLSLKMCSLAQHGGSEMARIELTSKTLVVHVTGADRFLALKSQLEVPLTHVTAAEADPEIAKAWWKGWRAPGVNVPGVITAGMFYRDDKRMFSDVHDPERTIVIHLADEQYNALIVEVEEPKATADAIARAASAAR
jgi:hypothetical protein